MKGRLLPLLLVVLCGSDSPRPDLTVERTDLNGTWRILDSAPKEREVLWVISGQALQVFQGGNQVNEGTIFTDASRNPPTADVTFTRHGRTAYLGIFKIEGSILQIREVRVTPGGKKRPTSFDQPDSDILLKFERTSR